MLESMYTEVGELINAKHCYMISLEVTPYGSNSEVLHYLLDQYANIYAYK